jgi:hypothetical protein
MISIDLSNKDVYQDNNSLFQWDYGQSLAISGLNVTNDIEVHFARKNTEAEIRIGTFSDGIVTVAIPDMILQRSGMFSAYIYQTDATSGETIKIIHMNVRERERPTDYTTPEYKNVVYELNSKLDQIIETGIANYEPDPAVVDALVTQKVNSMLATLGNLSTKDQVAKTDLTTALATELDGKINSSKITTTLAPTQTGFIHDAKTVGDAIIALNANVLGDSNGALTLTSYIQANYSTVFKRGKTVELGIDMTIGATTPTVWDWSILATIPDGYRPKNSFAQIITTYDGSFANPIALNLEVTSAGIIRAYTVQAISGRTIKIKFVYQIL